MPKPNSNNNIIYTIGHSTRTIEEFIKVLKEYKIKCVIDIRTVPKSRTNPQFNKEILPNTLTPHKIKYFHFESLGGLRKSTKSINSVINAYWQNKSFKNFANYAMSDEFLLGLYELTEISKKSRCVIMCAEVLWWRCHRRIITDYLLAANHQVIHIFECKKSEPGYITKAAIIEKRLGIIIYPN